MSDVTRRSFIKWGLSAGAVASAGSEIRLGAARAAGASFDFGLVAVGEVKPVSALSIAASPLSVGFETLDRRHFDPKRTYPHLARLGAKWARCQTGWCRCEVTKGSFDFTWLDEVVDSLRKLGVQPWFNLGYGNRLYSPQARDEAAVGWAPIFTEAARSAWVRFTRRIAEHFRDRVRHWEVWNEPNISSFWKPKKPNPSDYVALVKLTAPEVRRLVPKAVVIGGAFAGIPMSYLKGCLEQGLADHVDKISYHPYRAVPESGYEGQIRDLRKLIAAHKQGIELWQGENGCPSRGGKGSVGALVNLEWDEARQAKWLLRRILSDLRLGIELTSYFHLVDLVGYRGKTNYKGLLRGSDYSPKPAYRAYQCQCALFDSQTRREADLTLELVGQRKVHLQDAGFVRGRHALYAYWFPANLQKGWAPRRLTVRVLAPPNAAIAHPVLIDPLTSRIYKLEAARRGKDSLTFDHLPLLDYPLVITDRAVAMRK